MSRNVTTEEFEREAMPHLNDLFRTAMRVLRDRGEAEDVVQEAYYQAWKSFHRYEPGTNCRAWLFKILFRVIKRHRYKWSRWIHTIVADKEPPSEELFVYEPPVPEHLEDEEILGALDRISEKYREILLLVDVEEFAYREVAETLGIPIGTVMSRLSRARRALRSQMAESGAASNRQRRDAVAAGSLG